jgi:hypothetical protein
MVVPGKPDHLSLEPTPDAAASPHKDNPADSVFIAQNQTNGMVYAVIRDQYGNYITASQSTGWLSRDTTIVTVTGGITSIGQGVITNVLTAQGDHTIILATSKDYPGLKDSTMAVLIKYYYTALRIVNTNGNAITSLTMNTNQDTTIQVQGLRSDGGGWEAVCGVWTVTSGLVMSPAAPTSASTWTFSPNFPGTGKINVRLGDTTRTTPAHIAATFTVGPPVTIQTQILTPVGQRIAGDTIIAITRILNKYGLVPGSYCDSATYMNALGNGGTRPNPTVDGTKMGNSMYECFQNGIDTVKYVLYYAPPASVDSMEKVVVTFEGLNAASDPFLLNAGPLARISLVDNNGNLVDSVHLNYPNGATVINAIGYDMYGNKRGLETSQWTTNGTLQALDSGARTNSSRLYFAASSTNHTESGYLIATATGPGGNSVVDSVFIIISGPGSVHPARTNSFPPKLRVYIPNAAVHVFPLPADVVRSNLSFVLYSVSGRQIFKVENIDAEKPLFLDSSLETGIYLMSLRSAQRQIARGRFAIVK